MNAQASGPEEANAEEQPHRARHERTSSHASDCEKKGYLRTRHDDMRAEGIKVSMHEARNGQIGEVMYKNMQRADVHKDTLWPPGSRV